MELENMNLKIITLMSSVLTIIVRQTFIGESIEKMNIMTST